MRGLFVSFLIGAFVSISTVSAEAILPYPKAMATLGDSIAEGMLAGYSLEKPPSLGTALNLLWLSSDADKNQRMSVFRKKLARPDLSWAAGSNTRSVVKSHAERLQEFVPDLKVSNFAISGNTSFDLAAQVDELLAAEDRQALNFDYVTLMIGANDLAEEDNSKITSPLEYIGNIETSLRRVLDKDPHRYILVSSLPDVHSIFEQSQGFAAISAFGEEIKCGKMRRTIYGPKTVFVPENVDAYNLTKEIMSQYREGLNSLVERLQMEYPETNLRMVRHIPDPLNVKKALSIDCFHPSEWGQAELAEVTWKQGFWPHHEDSGFAAFWNK